MMGKTHGFETMSETTAYRNHIKNSEIENREVFEREFSSPEKKSTDTTNEYCDSTR